MLKAKGLPRKSLKIPKRLQISIGRVKVTPRKRPKPSKLRKELEKLQKELTIKLYGTDCLTCPQKNLVGANCQLGHVPWPRSILSTECKYSLDFVRIQCFRCNIHLGGNGATAYIRMKKSGIDLDEMWERNEATKGKTYNTQWFEAQITLYTTTLEGLEK